MSPKLIHGRQNLLWRPSVMKFKSLKIVRDDPKARYVLLLRAA